MTGTLTRPRWSEAADALAPRGETFVDGAFAPAESGATFTDTSPRDGRVVAQVARGDAADVDRAVWAARRAFEGQSWSGRAPRERKAVLLRLAEAMEARLEELALLEALDGGKPIREALAVDVPGAIACLRWYAEAADKVYGESAPVGPDALAVVEREPLGVVGAVVPWNYPLIITAWKLSPALVMGNSVVLKPAEETPLSALAVAEMASEAGLPDGVLNVVPGFGPEAGEALGRHPDVDKIAFTGSVEVGRRFQVYAGESNGKQVSLELGGKSAHVVLRDADLDAAATAIAWGIFYHAGQTCHAGSRVVVEDAVHDPLVERIAAVAATLQPGDPLAPDTVVGSLIGEPALERALRHIRQAVDRDGARLVCGGGRVQPVHGGAYLAPTVLDGVQPDTALAHQEVFAPVLAVQRAPDPETAVELANATDYGLAAAVWTRDVAQAGRIARRLRAGTVWVNTYDAGDLSTPFGGVRASGHGRDRSLHALDAYAALKTTWIALS